MKPDSSPTVTWPALTRWAPSTTRPTLTVDGITSRAASNVPRRRTALIAGVADVGGDRRQSLGLARLGAVGLDELHAFEALVHAGGQRAELVLGLVVVAIDTMLVDDVEHDQDREHGDGDETEHDVGRDHPRPGDDDHEHRARRERDRCQDAHRGVGVDAGPGDELAVGPALVPRHGLAHEAIDHAVGERLRDPPLRDPGERAPDDDTGRPHDPDADQERDPADHGRHRDLALLEAGQDHVVDDPSHGEARGDRAECEHRGAGDGDREHPRVESDHRDDQVQPAPGALEPRCRGSANPPRLSTSGDARSVERMRSRGLVLSRARRRARRSSRSSRSGRTRCSSPRRNRSTRSATASGLPAPRPSAGRPTRHARSWPTSGASTPTMRRCSASVPTSSTAPPTSSSRWSTTSSPSSRPTRRAGRSCPTGRPTTGPTSRTAAISPTSSAAARTSRSARRSAKACRSANGSSTFAADNEMRVVCAAA